MLDKILYVSRKSKFGRRHEVDETMSPQKHYKLKPILIANATHNILAYKVVLIEM